jgi:predicted membrane protein
MSNARIIWRKTVNYVMLTLTGVAAFGVVSVLFLILGYLIWNGGTSLNLNRQPEAAFSSSDHGIAVRPAGRCLSR